MADECDEIGQPAPYPAAAAAPAGATGARLPTAVLAVMTSLMGLVVGGFGAATWVAREGHWDSYNRLFGYFMISSAVLSVPLLISSIKLIRRESEWMPIGILGAAVGGVGFLAVVLLVLFVIAWGLACGSEGCLR